MAVRLLGIDHIVLRVRDIARASRFYGEVLGCVEERRLDDVGMIQLRAGAALIDLVDVAGEIGRFGGAAPGIEGRNLEHVALRIAEFDAAALIAHLDAHHVPHSPVATRHGAEGDGPSIYIEDPDGNNIELKGPPAG